MKIFDEKKTKELQLSELNLELGSLISKRMVSGDTVEDILVYVPDLVKARSRISALKTRLRNSDYKAIKYAEGELTAEEYAPTKQLRREWRAQINELEAFIKEMTATE